MARNTVLIALTCASLGVVLSCLAGGAVAELVFGVLAMAFAPLLMVLGTTRGRRSPALVPIILLGVLLEGCLVGMWIYRGTVATGPWWLGLPAVAAIQIYGLLVLPQIVVALGFALTFESFDVGDEELAALRRLAPADEE